MTEPVIQTVADFVIVLAAFTTAIVVLMVVFGWALTRGMK